MFHLSKRDSIRVVFLGDSITARGCFDEFFEEKSIVNRGIGSDVTEGIFNRVEEIISLNPKQVFIMAGINDISVGVEPEKSADFMKKTCEKIHTKLPDTEIYIESILPTKNVEWKEKIKELNKLYKTICDEEGYVYIDIYSDFFSGEKLNTDLFCDDVHLDGAGYGIWVDKIKDFVDR